MIKLRLRRTGAKKRPSYRIVAADSRSKRDGRIIEQIGFYDPLTEPATIKFNEERAAYWLSVGAQPTETVHILLRNQGLVPDDKAERAVTPPQGGGRQLASPAGGASRPFSYFSQNSSRSAPCR